MATYPPPIVWPPSQQWDGIDGRWSSFALRVGTPEQLARVLISTKGTSTWLVTPEGCPTKGNDTISPSACIRSRGGIFDPTKSTSWKGQGNHTLEISGNFFAEDESGTYGLDTVALDISDSTERPPLQSQVVAGFSGDQQSHVGMFGLSKEPTNFTNFDNPQPSFLTSLRTKNLIPSLTWAYTAGAHYRQKGVFASLVFGGYDLSRFIPSNVILTRSPEMSRDLIVGLQAITWVNNKTITSLVPSPILTFIDSSTPFIYLPVQACQQFERAFGLTWDRKLNMYLLNDSLHQSLLHKNPSFTFRIGNNETSNATIDITLPYASFDLIAQPPLVSKETPYFPIRPALKDTQYTLGRAFLQEAYLTVDYENSTFAISPCKFEDLQSDIVPSLPKPAASVQPVQIQNHLSKTRKITIAVSVSVGLVLILSILFLILVLWKQRRRTIREGDKSKRSSSSSKYDLQNSRIARNLVSELHNQMKLAQLPDTTSSAEPLVSVQELFSPPRQVVPRRRVNEISTETALSKRQGTSQSTTPKAPLRPHSKFSVAVGEKRPKDNISPVASRLKAVDLNRSLPPLPVNESVQASMKPRNSALERSVRANTQELVDLIDEYLVE